MENKKTRGAFKNWRAPPAVTLHLKKVRESNKMVYDVWRFLEISVTNLGELGRYAENGTWMGTIEKERDRQKEPTWKQNTMCVQLLEIASDCDSTGHDEKQWREGIFVYAFCDIRVKSELKFLNYFSKQNFCQKSCFVYLF